MKPYVRTTHRSRRFAYEVALDTKSDLLKKVAEIRIIMSSRAITSIFLLIAQGTESPTELASRIGKSKFLVSQYLSKLKKTLVEESSRHDSDLRRKRYSVSWRGVGDIFRQDHALELELYENHLLAEVHSDLRGSLGPIELVVLGTGKVGLLKTVRIEHSENVDNSTTVSEQMNLLIEEFVQLFRGYITRRRYRTLREYFLGIYKELSENFQRIPKTSALRKFYAFTDRTFEKIELLEDLWVDPLVTKVNLIQTSHRVPSMQDVKLFSEAGKTDFSGNYILNANTAEAIRPDTRLRIYPSYTYEEEGKKSRSFPRFQK
jgi:hypothetical protein